MAGFIRKGVIHYSAPHHDAIYDETQEFIKGFARRANLSQEVAGKVVRSIAKDLTQVLSHKLSLCFRQLLPEGLKRECETLELVSHKHLSTDEIGSHIRPYLKRDRTSASLIKTFWNYLISWSENNKKEGATKLISELPKDLKSIFDQ